MKLTPPRGSSTADDLEPSHTSYTEVPFNSIKPRKIERFGPVEVNTKYDMD